MILFCAIILNINFVVTFILGKWFKYELEELVLAAVIISGGPMKGVAVAISKNWHNLIVPSLMLGVWGYVIRIILVTSWEFCFNLFFNKLNSENQNQ
ncbi:MAG: DUF819 family protein [Bacteroidota bacterium]